MSTTTTDPTMLPEKDAPTDTLTDSGTTEIGSRWRNGPWTNPQHPAFELLKGKIDMTIRREILAMIDDRSAGALFMELWTAEATFTSPGQAFSCLKETLANALGVSVSTVYVALQKLKKMSLVIVTRDRNKKKAPNYYQINWKEFCKRMHAFYTDPSAGENPEADEQPPAPVRPSVNEALVVPSNLPPPVESIDIHILHMLDSRRVRAARGPVRHRTYKATTNRKRILFRSWISMLRRITRIARNVGRENGTRTLAEALGCLYDADGNPRLDKPPLKGEPEKLFCARYGNVPDVCANWLRTTAMQRPLADLLIAIYKADRDDPEDVIRIANEIQLNRAPTVIELRPNTVLVGHVSEIGLQVIRTQPQAVRIVSSPRLKAVNGR